MSPCRSIVLPLLLSASLAACDAVKQDAEPDHPAAPQAASLDAVAKAYVQLVLELGRHDADYVDAFYGPAELKDNAETNPRDVEAISAAAVEQLKALADVDTEADTDPLVELRKVYLEKQLGSLKARADMLAGREMTFDEESEALYDAVAPTLEADYFQGVLDRLQDRLAAEGFTEGTAIERLEAFRRDFIIPPDNVDAVFRAAIDACRERTSARLELPPGESFTVEYVNDKSWSAYNWYQGDFQSLIQVNLDLPIYIDRAIDLACHEGYPGHHVYNALLEKNLVRDRGWMEVSVYPLFSPQSLIAEGSANYGIEMAFPGDTRTDFEARELYPLAGLDASKAAVYQEIMDLTAKLAYAGNEAARGYLDGTMSEAEAVDWLVTYAAMTRPRAEQRLRFIEQYRSYVINYNLGQDLVRRHLDAEAGEDYDARWRLFTELLSTPRLPSGLSS